MSRTNEAGLSFNILEERTGNNTLILPRNNKEYQLYTRNTTIPLWTYPIQHSDEPHELLESDFYSYQFNVGLFIQILCLYILLLIGIGSVLLPVIFVFSCFRIPMFFRNFFKISPLHGVLLFLSPFFVIMIITKNIEINQILAIGATILFLIIGQSASIAYQNNKFPNLLKSKNLSKGSLEAMTRLIRLPGESENHDESLHSVITRLNIDVSCLYFKVVQKISGRPLQLKRDLILPDTDIYEDGAFFRSKILISEEEILDKALDFERKVFFNKNFTEETICDQERLCGYALAKALISRPFPFKSKYLQFCRILIFLLTLVPMISSDNWELLLNFSFDTIVMVVGFVILFILTLFVLYILLIAIQNLNRRICFMKELGSYISLDPNNISLRFNMLDYMSLRTWITLRKILMHYGDREMKIISLVIAIVLGFHLFMVAIAVLEYFGIFINPDWSRFLVIFGPGSIVYFLAFIALIYLGYNLNQQYKAHQENIQKLKSMVISLFALHPNFSRHNYLNPKGFLVNEGIDLLKKEFEENTYKQEINEKFQMLMEVYNDILADLNFEAQQYPFRILGVSVNDAFVKSVAAATISLASTVVTKEASKIFK